MRSSLHCLNLFWRLVLLIFHVTLNVNRNYRILGCRYYARSTERPWNIETIADSIFKRQKLTIFCIDRFCKLFLDFLHKFMTIVHDYRLLYCRTFLTGFSILTFKFCAAWFKMKLTLNSNLSKISGQNMTKTAPDITVIAPMVVITSWP